MSGAITDLRADVNANSDTFNFFSNSSFVKNPPASVAFAEGQASRVLGMISRAGGCASVKCPPSTFYLLSEANCKQELIVV